MVKHTPLKNAIYQSAERQFIIAKRARIHESRLSVLVNGHQRANETEAKALAKVLKTSMHALFPDQFPADEAVAS